MLNQFVFFLWKLNDGSRYRGGNDGRLALGWAKVDTRTNIFNNKKITNCY